MELNELLTQYEVSTGLHNLPTADEIAALSTDERKALADKMAWRLGRNISTTVGYNFTFQGKYTDMAYATKSELYQAIIDMGSSYTYTYSVSLSGAEHVVMNPTYTYATGGSVFNTTLELTDNTYVISKVNVTNGSTVLPEVTGSYTTYAVSLPSVDGNVSIVVEESTAYTFSSTLTVNDEVEKKAEKKSAEKHDEEPVEELTED